MHLNVIDELFCLWIWSIQEGLVVLFACTGNKWSLRSYTLRRLWSTKQSNLGVSGSAWPAVIFVILTYGVFHPPIYHGGNSIWPGWTTLLPELTSFACLAFSYLKISSINMKFEDQESRTMNDIFFCEHQNKRSRLEWGTHTQHQRSHFSVPPGITLF